MSSELVNKVWFSYRTKSPTKEEVRIKKKKSSPVTCIDSCNPPSSLFRRTLGALLRDRSGFDFICIPNLGAWIISSFLNFCQYMLSVWSPGVDVLRYVDCYVPVGTYSICTYVLIYLITDGFERAFSGRCVLRSRPYHFFVSALYCLCSWLDNTIGIDQYLDECGKERGMLL